MGRLGAACADLDTLSPSAQIEREALQQREWEYAMPYAIHRLLAPSAPRTIERGSID